WPAGRARKAVAAFLACAACGCVAACGASAAAAGGPAYEVRASAVRGLGRVLADGHGFTLYIYGPDRHGASVCTGLCAKQWPPLPLPRGVRHPIAGSGATAGLLGTTRRADGSLQITYNGWPLYLWQDDQEPGQQRARPMTWACGTCCQPPGPLTEPRCPVNKDRPPADPGWPTGRTRSTPKTVRWPADAKAYARYHPPWLTCSCRLALCSPLSLTAFPWLLIMVVKGPVPNVARGRS
ncbi:MAG TPA: hypothetical protein VLW50_26420, partial [Streptosporangiaceae bacterium]|nr:hypothetical protein [Streptosporangiaceae bacterium]